MVFAKTILPDWGFLFKFYFWTDVIYTHFLNL
jgi:hypothetical protein